MLRESSLFAAGVRWQVGNVCCFDLQQLHLREVDGVILKSLNERKHKVWQLKAGKKKQCKPPWISVSFTLGVSSSSRRLTNR